ncbi:hypothetical protein LJR234_001491 [Mesorhizobium amorphae]|uniref:hypothetical protein n=1 Tax=Mesorhizobium amorphae TaxID=71433 RepID=UPI003ECDD618
MPPRVHLKRVESDGDWAAYHRIRKRVLWEDRGLGGYDERHPDDRLAGIIHYSLCAMVRQRGLPDWTLPVRASALSGS